MNTYMAEAAALLFILGILLIVTRGPDKHE